MRGDATQMFGRSVAHERETARAWKIVRLLPASFEWSFRSLRSLEFGLATGGLGR